MAEENKEEVKKPAEPKPAEQKPAEPAAPSPAAAPQKKEEVKIEKPANCASCNKSIKNKRWYYRDGKYYCSKRCWQTAAKKAKEEAKEKEKAPEAPTTPPPAA